MDKNRVSRIDALLDELATLLTEADDDTKAYLKAHFANDNPEQSAQAGQGQLGGANLTGRSTGPQSQADRYGAGATNLQKSARDARAHLDRLLSLSEWGRATLDERAKRG